MTHISKILIFLLIFLSVHGIAQDRFSEIEKKLEELSQTNKGFNQRVELSVTNVSLQEFLTGIAITNNLNINVDNSVKSVITNNFVNVTVKEVLMFLVKKYELDIVFMGSILSVVPYKTPEPPPVKSEPKKVNISFNNSSGVLDLDLKEDSLFIVAKEITELTGKNVVLAPGLNGKLVSAFVKNAELSKALDLLAFANELKVFKTDDGFYQIEKANAPENSTNHNQGSKQGNSKQRPTASNKLIELKVKDSLIELNVNNVSITEIIYAVSSEMNKNFFLFSEPKGNATLTVSNATFDQFLGYLLNGTEFTFKNENQIYLIGERNLEGLRTTRVVQLQHRTIEKVIDFIPPDLKKGVDIKSFPELNSLILSGSTPIINELSAFIRDIDRVVPVIMIEVVIVDVKRGRTVSTGIKAGIGEAPVKSGGTVLPGVDYTLNANSLNALINSFNGLGLFNLGKVTPNFYINLKALEEQGVINIRSTPKLATLNGHEARMSIGKTEYYLEIQNNVIGSQNPQNIISQQYKSVTADLSLIINPIVSGDDQITLDIKVQQSDFTARISPNAPPGTVKRDFQSLIRVKNDEMIILGGLEEEGHRTSSSGLPFLARIPVISWFFGNKSREKIKARLNIFIKPTIIY